MNHLSSMSTATLIYLAIGCTGLFWYMFLAPTSSFLTSTKSEVWASTQTSRTYSRGYGSRSRSSGGFRWGK